MKTISILKSVAALILALMLTAVYGLFAGVPVDPEFARQRINQLEEIDREHPVMTPEDRKKLWDEGISKLQPPRGERTIITDIRSAIVWNSYLFAALFAVLLIIFRPSFKEAVISSVILCFALYSYLGASFSILVALATVIFVVVMQFVNKVISVQKEKNLPRDNRKKDSESIGA